MNRLSCVGLVFLGFVCVCFGLRFPYQPQPPRIAPQFSANATAIYEIFKDHHPAGNFTFYVTVFYDEKKSRVLLHQDIGDNLILKNASYRLSGDECYPASQKNITFLPAFAWLNRSEYIGHFIINGVKTEGWHLEVPTFGVMLNLTLYTIGNVPIRLVVAQNPKPLLMFSITYNFVAFEVQNGFPDSVFQVPKSCWADGFLCPNGTIETQEFYRFHPLFDWNLSNHNAADLLGDAAYICLSPGILHDQLISLLQVQVNTSWGQYAFCNNHSCVGLNIHSVGREASFGSGTNHSGQCSPNTEAGSWFSFPSGGECKEDQEIGNQSCTWKLVKRVKTISILCLFSHSFVNACHEHPYENAKRVLNNAFQFDDKSKGGCPPINPNNDMIPVSSPTRIVNEDFQFKRHSTNKISKWNEFALIDKYTQQQIDFPTLFNMFFSFEK